MRNLANIRRCGLNKGANKLLPETRAYNTRVVADGGYIQDINVVDAEIKAAKDASEYSTLLRFYPEKGGIKIDSRLGVNYVTKIYDVKGASGDIIIAAEIDQPILQIDGSYLLDEIVLQLPAIAGTATTCNILFEFEYKIIGSSQRFGYPSTALEALRFYLRIANDRSFDFLGYMDSFKSLSSTYTLSDINFETISLQTDFGNSKLNVYVNNNYICEVAGTNKDGNLVFALGDTGLEANGYLKSAKVRQWN